MNSDQQPPEGGLGLPDAPAWNVAWSYAVLRFTLGTTFLFHGVTRFVSGWSAFADQMVQNFHNTFLPDFMVRPFALSVPPVEAVLGTLLCLGLLTRWTEIKTALMVLGMYRFFVRALISSMRCSLNFCPSSGVILRACCVP